MKSHTLRLCLIAALTCVTAAAMAENPFAGTWKVDYSKRPVTGQTIGFTSETGGTDAVGQTVLKSYGNFLFTLSPSACYSPGLSTH